MQVCQCKLMGVLCIIGCNEGMDQCDDGSWFLRSIAVSAMDDRKDEMSLLNLSPLGARLPPFIHFLIYIWIESCTPSHTHTHHPSLYLFHSCPRLRYISFLSQWWRTTLEVYSASLYLYSFGGRLFSLQPLSTRKSLDRGSLLVKEDLTQPADEESKSSLSERD